MGNRFESFEEYIKSNRGLKDLHTIYGNCCLPVMTCIDDLRNHRCFWIGGRIVVATDDGMLQELRERAYGDLADQAPMPLDLSKYTYDEDGTLPASESYCPFQEAYAIVEEPCGAGFRYVGLRTREEYERYKRENPCCYG